MISHIGFLVLFWIFQVESDIKWQDIKPEVPLFRRKCTALRTNDGWYNVHCIHCEFTGMPPELPKLTRTLDMSYNNIDKIKVNSFSPTLHHLQKLNMSHNFIFSIDDSAFIGVIGNTIEILDLSYNQLRTLPNFFPNSLRVLKLNHNLFEKFYLFDIAYLYSLKGLHLNNNRIKVLGIKPSVRTCDAIEVFLKLQKGPSEKSFILPSLDFLDLSNNKIKKLSSHVLRTLPYLTLLRAKHNSLASMSNGTFVGNHICLLRYIDLSHNKLKEIEKGTFWKCPLLKYLSLAHNHLEKFPIGLNILEWLDVSFNRIRSISVDLKPSLYPQEILLLGGNPFHCDCRLKWLKEFFDTREYMLPYLSVDYQQFIPSCATPDILDGEFWDVLSSDMFYCVQSNPNQDDLSKDDEESSTKIKVELAYIESGSTGIHLMWGCSRSCEGVTAFRVKYRVFGHKEFHVSLPFTSVTRSYTLQGLRSNTPYVICLSVYNVEGEEDDTCIEVMTLSKNKFYFQTLANAMNSSLVYFMIFLIVVLILYNLS